MLFMIGFVQIVSKIVSIVLKRLNYPDSFRSCNGMRINHDKFAIMVYSLSSVACNEHQFYFEERIVIPQKVRIIKIIF